ncbi:MAG: transporter substrate-binding domain-containing protein [Hyphomicrobiales bacterium]|nr:transporter substrate-binding domain-containing protein [Hyphomicrobiales bacterium]MBV8661830.1 transporter substrate-binding domain-containing protein [Hyphomicrobiales bacterium]
MKRQDIPTAAWASRRAFGKGLGAALLGALVAPPAFALDETLLAPEIRAIKQRGKLVVGLTSFDSPPFYYQRKKSGGDGGAALDGFDIQLAREIARSLEVELVFNRQAEDFNKVVELVMTGQVDLATSKLSLTVKRAIGVLFSRPTIELRHALLANRISLARSADGRPPQEVINRHFVGSIGVIADSSFVDIARQLFSSADIRQLKNWEAVVDAVNMGDVDIAYRDELEIKRIMHLRPELHLNVRSVLISDERDLISVAMRYQSEQLANLVNVILLKRKKLDANQLLDEYADIFATA